MANKALEEALRVLSPHFSQEEVTDRIVIGTVQGNIMESGVNLIAAMLRAEGFGVTNLGVSVAPERFLEKVKKQRAQIVALGIYTSECTSMVERVAQLVRYSNLPCKILVGGKGISTKKARELGAHAFARDGNEAVERVKELLAGMG
ncbi:MAG: cobalamin-dependent protein [Thermodesulfobacteriota bacterium]